MGVGHTTNGRQILAEGVTTMTDIYKSNGDATSIFGKWHLRDNYPFRPQDSSFDEG
ncbi:MAG: arylsulfatase A-like enzyme [Psychromonas sp.]